MAYRVKTYMLREEASENGTRYFISFKDGQGGYHKLQVSEQFFIEFQQMERKNRNLLQSDERHKEFFEFSDEALNRSDNALLSSDMGDMFSNGIWQMEC